MSGRSRLNPVYQINYRIFVNGFGCLFCYSTKVSSLNFFVQEHHCCALLKSFQSFVIKCDQSHALDFIMNELKGL